ALGWIEGVADLFVSLSKLAGGYVGHIARRKQPLAALGYLVTALATGAIALVETAAALVSLRSGAWAARGFRGPLRDFLLADAVDRSRYGRAHGLERAADMLGAVAGPLAAATIVALGFGFRSVILWSAVPGVVAAGAMLFLVRERRAAGPAPGAGGEGAASTAGSNAGPGAGTGTHRDAGAGPAAIPRAFWVLLAGVLLFGLGDFSRTFLILLAGQALGGAAPAGGALGGGAPSAGAFSAAAVGLYALHNAVSAAAAYPAGALGDRFGRRRVLVAGYAVGVATNLLLAGFSGSAACIGIVIVLSGVYVAVEETLEKALAASILPREVRSLGLGLLAAANSVGDMASSVAVGHLLDAGRPGWAFGLAAGAGALGVLWLAATARWLRLPQPS
ncbi:MAG: MFS transporter, partial [Planctomycetes bacterium]|nr:MFS transporter [Planctomycetota bacterium]